MKPSRFVVQLVLWAMAIVGLNLFVARASRNSVPRALVGRIDRSPGATDVMVGNSLVKSGADPVAFAEAAPGRTLFNAGLGSSYPPEHFVLLRRSLRLKPERVYYGYFDGQLFAPAPSGWGDLVGSRAMAYTIDPDVSLPFYAKGDPLTAWRMRTIAKIPLLVERQALWSNVEKLRRRLSAIGVPPVETNQFGRASDFALLEAGDPKRFLLNCDEIAAAKLPFDAPVRAMVDAAKRSGARVILVEMPMTSSHRNRFYDHPEWSRLRDHIREEARRSGAELIVASDWIPDDKFADHLHLNPRGAEEFSRRLAATSTSP